MRRALIGMALLLAGCGGAPPALRPVSDLAPIAGIDLVLVADVRHTDEKAIAGLVEEARGAGIRYGVIAGDIAELGCRKEGEELFRVLRHQPDVKFIVALGEREVVPRGERAKWRDVCGGEKELLTKAAMIDLILSYYRYTWKLGIPTEPSPAIWKRGEAEGAAPPAYAVKPGDGTEVAVELSYRTRHTAKNCDEPSECAHRESYLFQRFVVREGGPATVVTVLDGMELGDGGEERGRVSPAQVAWLRERARVEGTELLVSHAAPVEGEMEGVRKSGLERWIAGEDGPAVVAVGHAVGGMKLALVAGSARGVPVVRLPSLAEGKGYVWWKGGKFAERKLK